MSTFVALHPEHAETPLGDVPPRVLADWLLCSLRGHLLDGEGMRAYGAEADLILTGEDLPHGLMKLANRWGEARRMLFRAACAYAVEALRFHDPADLRIADVLIDFAGLISATKVLEVLARKAVSVAPDDWPPDFYQAVLDLTRAAAPQDGEGAAILLRHLVASRRRFPLLQVGRTLEALACADPSNLPEHWALLTDAINERYSPRDELGSDPGYDREEERRIVLRSELLQKLATRVPNKRLLLLDCQLASGDTLQAPQWWRDTLYSSADPEVQRVLPRLLSLPPFFATSGLSQDGRLRSTLEVRLTFGARRQAQPAKAPATQSGWAERCGFAVPAELCE